MVDNNELLALPGRANQEELIWGGDHDTEDNEEYDMVSNLSCPNCHCHVEVYHPSESLIKEYKDHENANKSE